MLGWQSRLRAGPAFWLMAGSRTAETEPEADLPRTKARNKWRDSGKGQEAAADAASSRNTAVGRSAGAPAAGDGRETAAGLSARAAGLAPTANICRTRPSYKWRDSNREPRVRQATQTRSGADGRRTGGRQRPRDRAAGGLSESRLQQVSKLGSSNSGAQALGRDTALRASTQSGGDTTRAGTKGYRGGLV